MIPHLTAPTLNLPGIRHGFFTREGGGSNGLYASLNIGYGSGDDKAKVCENRRHVAKALSSTQDEILTCYQIHSNICHIVSSMEETHQEGDALVTNAPNLPIAVLTADCVPVLFADAEAKVIGAAHAGWKGAKAGILGSTIDAMETLGATKEHIIAAIGPAISQASYEVGNELMEQFTAEDQAYQIFFTNGGNSTHRQFDLPGLVAEKLRKLGVAKLEKLDYDTYVDERRFYSFRRATHRQESIYGRQCSVIMLTGE